MDTIQEPIRTTPVVANYDVLVCGGGPAGIAAAIASARAGARTGLVEHHGCLGGIWTAGALSWILDHANKDGIMRELLGRLDEGGSRAFEDNGRPTNAYDVEQMKRLLDEMCAEAGVVTQLYTRVVGALVNEGRRLTHVLTESKSGREAMAAKVSIDCTGDGDLGALAGCGYDLGHPETGKTQPMSLMAIVTGIQTSEIEPFYRREGQPWAAPKDRLKAEMERGGHSPSYSRPTLFRIRDDLFALMANHEYGVVGTSVRDLTSATIRARRELHALIDGLRSLGGIWQNIHIVMTGTQVGVREGRRILGRAVVSAEDLRVGARQPDAVCRVTFGIDVHSTDPDKQKGIEQAAFRSQPYDIPLRALIAQDVDGLMMAGRCISGDFLAHSSYRVTGNAVALGEAAGRVAAKAATTDRLPHQVALSEARDNS